VDEQALCARSSVADLPHGWNGNRFTCRRTSREAEDTDVAKYSGEGSGYLLKVEAVLPKISEGVDTRAAAVRSERRKLRRTWAKRARESRHSHTVQ